MSNVTQDVYELYETAKDELHNAKIDIEKLNAQILEMEGQIRDANDKLKRAALRRDSWISDLEYLDLNEV